MENLIRSERVKDKTSFSTILIQNSMLMVGICPILRV
jgi:hypothetical protein